MGIEEAISARRSPWQNPHLERVIGSIRCERTDHIIALGERHLLQTRAAKSAIVGINPITPRGIRAVIDILGVPNQKHVRGAQTCF